MPATKIMLIRHAEKPDDKDGGVDQKGNADKHDLIVRGWQRAGALVQFFANPRDPNGPIKRPATIFATEPTTGSESKRPLHTVTPLEQMARHRHRQHHCRRFGTGPGEQSDRQQRRGADRLAS